MKLYRITNKRFVAKDPRFIYTGSMLEVAKFLNERGYEISELELGFSELINKDHDYAEFGMRKMFIFSREFESEEVA